MARLIQQRAERLPISTKTDDELEELRERCTSSFREFVREAWPAIDKQPLIWGWHIDAIAEHLEAVTRGHIRYLLITVPPGSSKTSLVQILWPMWEWCCDQHARVPGFDTGYRPDIKYIFATYEAELARDKSLACRQFAESYWYQKLFGDRWTRNDEQWGKSIWSNTEGGFRMATSVGGRATGKHANRKVLDDPIKAQAAGGGHRTASKAELEEAWAFWSQTMVTRDVDKYTAEVVIMQRLHELDVAGRLIEEGAFEVLCIPQRFEASHPYQRVTVLQRDAEGVPVRTWKDPRTEDGELMCPERFPLDSCDTRARRLGPNGYAAQEQQRPSPAGGGIFKRDWFKFWTAMPKGGVAVLSADCTFKDEDTSDFVALQVWLALMPDFYLLDQVRDRLNVLATSQALVTLRNKWAHLTNITATLIEDKANGAAVATILKQKVPGIVLVEPLGGKVARANAASVYHASGNVYLPDPARHPWVHDFIEEHTSFPVGAYDDQVDAGTQALNYLGKGAVDFKRMLETMRKMGI